MDMANRDAILRARMLVGADAWDSDYADEDYLERAKKYELTEETKVGPNGAVLHRIRALRDFRNVKAGELGGWVQSEINLSQEGKAWVKQNARITDDARVSGDALVYGDAWVADSAKITERACVSGHAMIFGYAKMSGEAMAFDEARVFGNAQVLEMAHISGEAVASNNAIIAGNARVYGNACLTKNALIETDTDYAIVKGFGVIQRTTTFFRRQDGSVGVQCGCFYGGLQEFRWQVRKTHWNSKLAKEYLAIADLMELHFAKEGGDDHGADKEV